MCGIWTRGTLKRKIEKKELLHPVRTLAHRGPDGYGWYLENNVAMAHLRLSIIDLEGGQQPLVSFDKRYIGIVNGELYDYQHHRDALIQSGVTFQTKSDSEVLLNLYAKHGAQALSRLSGEYAFIFYDRKEKALIFGRDAHGVKPLFMTRQPGEITLSSEMKALAETRPVIDEVYVKRFIASMMTPPRTALAGCEHVLPGRAYHYSLSTGQLTWTTYYKLPLGQQRDLTKQEALEKVQEELSASVKRRLVADVEVGCYLSGGIDSALVAALMVQHGAKPKAFTVGFTHKELDETEKAGAIAKHLSIPHHVTVLSGGNFLENLKGSIVAFENPIANPHGAAKHLLSELAGSKVKVVLSGEGSDEWFGGYAYMRIRKIQEFVQKHPKMGAHALHLFMQKEKGGGMRQLDGASRKYEQLASPHFNGFNPALFGRIQNSRFIQHFTGSSPEQLVGEGMKEFSNYLHEESTLEHPITNEIDTNLWTGVRGDLLHYILGNVGDRQEMAHSLEGRTPFMDINLTEVAARIPQNVLVHGLTEKYPLRKIAQSLLPKEAVRTRKHAFFAPLQFLYLRDVRSALDEYIAVAREGCPWLPWKNLEHFVLKPKKTFNTPFLRDMIIGSRLILGSTGMLLEHLREPSLIRPRGYHLPLTEADLEGHEFKFSEESRSTVGGAYHAC